MKNFFSAIIINRIVSFLKLPYCSVKYKNLSGNEELSGGNM